MWIRIEHALRRAARLALAKVGTPPVSFALLALAAVYVTASALSVRDEAQGAARSLADSGAYLVLAVALAIDGLMAVLKSVPVEVREGGRHVLRRPDLSEAGAIALCAAYVLAGAAFTSSLLARDVWTVRIAEGEELVGAQDQFVAREPPRRMSAGPFVARLRVAAVAERRDARGAMEGPEVEVTLEGGRRAVTTPLEPLWFGWGRWVVPARTGYALEVRIATAGGVPLEGAFAKLDLLPPGRRDRLRLAALPHQVAISIPPGSELPASGPPPLEVEVRLGRFMAGGGRVLPGGSCAFDQFTFSVPTVRRWVEFRMIRDPGIGVAALAAFAALLGVLLRAFGRRRARSLGGGVT